MDDPTHRSRSLQVRWVPIVEGKLTKNCQVHDYLGIGVGVWGCWGSGRFQGL